MGKFILNNKILLEKRNITIGVAVSGLILCNVLISSVNGNLSNREGSLMTVHANGINNGLIRVMNKAVKSMDTIDTMVSVSKNIIVIDAQKDDIHTVSFIDTDKKELLYQFETGDDIDRERPNNGISLQGDYAAVYYSYKVVIVDLKKKTSEEIPFSSSYDETEDKAVSNRCYTMSLKDKTILYNCLVDGKISIKKTNWNKADVINYKVSKGNDFCEVESFGKLSGYEGQIYRMTLSENSDKIYFIGASGIWSDKILEETNGWCFGVVDVDTGKVKIAERPMAKIQVLGDKIFASYGISGGKYGFDVMVEDEDEASGYKIISNESKIKEKETDAFYTGNAYWSDKQNYVYYEIGKDKLIGDGYNSIIVGCDIDTGEEKHYFELKDKVEDLIVFEENSLVAYTTVGDEKNSLKFKYLK